MPTLSMDQIFHEVANGLEILDYVPIGGSKGHYYVRHDNYTKFQRGKFFTHPPDDTGVYFSHTTKYNVYQTCPDGRIIIRADLKYDAKEKRFYKRTTMDTLQPVSREEFKTLILSRSVIQKKEYNFARKLTYFLIVPPNVSYLHDVCLIEYAGSNDIGM